MQGLERFGPTSDLVFRALFSAIFVIAGFGHFVQQDVMLARLEEAPLGHLATLFGPPALLMSMSGGVLVGCGIALLVGFQVRLAALALMGVLVPITITIHVGDPAHIGPLFKNVALLGGLLHFAVRGAGAYGLGAVWARVRGAPRAEAA